MIAMQYEFTLPADYDMSIIDRRISEKGHMTDAFPGLVFKSYLTGRKTSMLGPEYIAENAYAPFYLWQSNEAMNAFLCGAGFVGVTQAFGWPSVKTWSVWHARISTRLAQACFATRASIPIASYAKLDALHMSELERADALVESGHALAAVTGFDPTAWTLVRFQLWEEPPHTVLLPEERLYEVGHVSTA